MLKDIPLFTTDAGIASLLLGEVSYRKEAYVRIRSVQPGKLAELLEECISFCRMVGAERVFALMDEAPDEATRKKFEKLMMEMR